MFGLIEQVYIGLLSFSGSSATIVSAHDHIKCVPLNNQQCMAQPTLFNLHPNQYLEGSKILTKYISCECKCKFHSSQCNSNQK